MSTASKVLIVLILLASLGWVYLITGVATLNRSYGEDLISKTKDLEQKQITLVEAGKEFARVNAEAEAAQDTFGLTISDLQARRENAFAQKAIALETQARLSLDQALLRKAGEQAAENQGYRETELTQHQEDLQKIEELSQAAQKRNEELRKSLEERRNEFLQLSQGNRQALGSASGNP